ncbi:MAG: flavodoxin-dependent (E)-4-hydroxy-3-methylbut-2-enyl-diphosphate synthase [Clostridiales bacterium]|nr:flavodoxin-dependent (E)-4-hydroxy-3-methylbut-2-enyl-diphosphate synthase [Clostridiales bacterium]
MLNRINSRQIHVGNVPVGGSSPITVQSMTNTNTSDIDATVKQITALENAGCDIIRVAVPDKDAAHAISSIKKQISIPLVADIHFDYKIALLSVEAGADKIRINPGNIGGRDRVRAVVSACKERNIPIRIGVNSGSVPKDLLEKYGGASPEALVESALSHIQLLEQEYFQDICISLKASDVPTTIESYRMMSKIRDYPLHVGVTEAGTAFMGTIKSSIGIGTLLSEGIGDTIRVSLTDKPEEEVRVGISILRALGLRKEGIEVVSCPTCGRTRIDLIGLAQRVESAVKDIDKELKIAVMGCAVNGPGEARDADVAVTGGDGVGMLFLRGKPYKKVPYDNLLDELLKLIDDFESNRDR